MHLRQLYKAHSPHSTTLPITSVRPSNQPPLKAPLKARAAAAEEEQEMPMEMDHHDDNSVSPPLKLVFQCTVYPSRPSTRPPLKLSVSDLPMLSCHYIQKGLLFPRPAIPIVPLLRLSLSRALSHFPALAGRLLTDPSTSRVFVSCNDAGVPFSHHTTTHLSLPEILLSQSETRDVPASVKDLFDLDGAVSYEGHSRPLAAVWVTELGDGSVFVGCTVNHAVVDGTSFWNFFSSWAELCRASLATAGGDGGSGAISRPPDFSRNFFGDSHAVLRFADGKGPQVTFDAGAPLRERIFHFSAHAIRELKSRANSSNRHQVVRMNGCSLPPSAAVEVQGKQVHNVTAGERAAAEVSSFQSLCALLWRHVTIARDLPAGTASTFRMAVNCRHRVAPPVSPYYFGNAIQSIPTTVPAGDVAARAFTWSAALLRDSVAAYGDGEVRRVVETWEAKPACFPLGNPTGAGVTMGSSPRFPMYDNDFGWGRPVAVRSGRANKFDGKVSAFPGREGGGSVDLEVCLKPETMEALLADGEFMRYVSEEEEVGGV